MYHSFDHILRGMLRTYTLRFPLNKGKGRLVEITKKWTQPGAPLLANVGNGYLMSLDLTDLIQRSIYYFGYYEPAFSLFLQRLLQKGDTFVDAGANIGQFSILAAQSVGSSGHVLAIEPERRNMEQLRTNVALNKLENVKTFEVALGAQPGNSSFYTRGAEAGFTNRGVHSFHQHDDWLNPQETTVQVSTLDSILASETGVDVMKLDVEGAELSALTGGEKLLRQHEPIICLEANEICTRYFGHSTVDVKSWLVERGYLLIRFCGNRFEQAGSGPEVDSMLVAYKHEHEQRLYASL